MLETAISMVTACNVLYTAYENLSGIFKQDRDKMAQFDQIVMQVEKLHGSVERLSDTILYAPNLRAVEDAARSQQRYIDQLREVRETLEPLQRAMDSPLLSSAMILTPEKLQQSLGKNPWDVLIDVRPLSLFSATVPPEGIPVIFEHNGIQFIGWQLRGTLQMSFDCRYNELWLPERVHQPSPMVTNRSSSTADLVVSPRGPYKTITAALRAAKAGNRIAVKAGLYRESIKLDKSVEIIGERGVTVESKDGSCLIMQTKTARVQDLTLQCRAGANNLERFAVDVPQGQLVLAHCDITSDSLSCVGIHGDNAHATVVECRIHNDKQNGKQSGIYVYNNGFGQIERCEIFGNANAGIAITTGGNPTVRQCRIHDGKGAGIVVCDNGLGQIEHCEIFRNAHSEINIRTGGNPTIRECRIHDGNGGISVHDNGLGQIEHCEIFGNAEAGIAIETGGNPLVQHCTIKNNGSGWLFSYAGVWVRNGGRGKVEECDLRDNGSGTWRIDDNCQVERRGNKE